MNYTLVKNWRSNNCNLEIMENSLSKKIVLGLVLVIVGLFLLLRNLGVLPYEIVDLFFNWPALLMVIGAVSLLNSRNKTTGAILFVIGGYFWLHNYLEINFSWARTFWPLLIIIIGVYILIKHSRNGSSEILKKKMSGEIEGDYFNDVAIFGGGDKKINSKAFLGGKATAIFGGSNINLSEVQLLNDQPAEIELFCVFGGIDLRIPKGWTVHSDVTPILGGFEDNRDITTVPADPRKVLRIKGLILLGGGDIKSA